MRTLNSIVETSNSNGNGSSCNEQKIGDMKHMKLYTSSTLVAIWEYIHVLWYFSKRPIAHQFFMQPGPL